MSRTTTRVAILVLTGTMLSASNALAQPRNVEPNVVLIITDDVGYGDFGIYGAPDIRTPNIDALARDGTRFTDFYASPQCTPTRASLITGRYQQRYQLERALPSAKNAGSRGLPATGDSLPQLLKNHGYATGLIGKWHLGYLPQHSPTAHGFDYFFGFKSGYIDYYQHTDSDGEDDLFENDARTQQSGYMTDLITGHAVEFVRKNASHPFFLEVTFNAAHWPFQVPDHPSVAMNHAGFAQPDDVDTSTRADYIKMVERADAGVGQILATLNDLNLSSNTLVIFTNDNGGEWLSRNAPLFHRKDTLWEGGIRVPLLMRWPGHIPPGRITNQVGIFMDLTATILSATHSPAPSAVKLEGIDLLPVITSQNPNVERTLLFRIDTTSRKQWAIRKGEWKVLMDGDDLLIFNLLRDIGERDDVAKEHPDVARALVPLLEAWEKDVDAEARQRTAEIAK